MNTENNIVEKLREQAIAASRNAYSPYSEALVGSAVVTTDGSIYSGCNVENSSYGGTICAERVAILKAVSEGHRRIEKVYVYSKAGWPPCGMCRQVMSEFASPTLEVIIGDAKGDKITMTFEEIFPLAFTPEHLDTK